MVPENLALLHGADIRGDGVIRNSFGGDVQVPWIDSADAGKIAAMALLHPERLGQDRLIYPAFTEQLTFPQIAKLVGERIGKSVRHETILPKEWQERLIRLSASDDRIDALMAEHLAVNTVVFSQSRRPASVNLLSFEAITGEKPMTLASAIASDKLTF